jgi:hypothetical protein
MVCSRCLNSEATPFPLACRVLIHRWTCFREYKSSKECRTHGCGFLFSMSIFVISYFNSVRRIRVLAMRCIVNFAFLFRSVRILQLCRNSRLNNFTKWWLIVCPLLCILNCRYIEDDEGIRKYFAAFHLLDDLPAAVIVDDFTGFFSERCYIFSFLLALVLGPLQFVLQQCVPKKLLMSWNHETDMFLIINWIEDFSES